MITGGAGFIGSNLLRALNARGCTDILVVDELAHDSVKLENCRGCEVVDFVDKDAFAASLRRGRLRYRVAIVFHQGACTNTLIDDDRFMMACNFAFSRRLLDWVTDRGIPMVYASSAAVYGKGTAFTEEPENEAPVNAYGRSKLAFDRYVRQGRQAGGPTLVGLRYFNVYGPGELHKGRMMSMVGQMYDQLVHTDRIRLFQGSDGFPDGGQRRDFVFVDDVVDVNLHFGFGAPRHGILNVGTGRSRSFAEVARAWIALMGSGSIEYVPMPASLRERYQSLTEADLTSLRSNGYREAFTPLESGVAEYHAWLEALRLQRPDHDASATP